MSRHLNYYGFYAMEQQKRCLLGIASIDRMINGGHESRKLYFRRFRCALKYIFQICCTALPVPVCVRSALSGFVKYLMRNLPCLRTTFIVISIEAEITKHEISQLKAVSQ